MPFVKQPVQHIEKVPVTVEADLPCIRCGYNLRAIQSDGKCPECGELVWRSRLTRPDRRAYQRFERLRVICGLGTLACFCTGWYAKSEMPRGTYRPDPVILQALFTSPIPSAPLLPP